MPQKKQRNSNKPRGSQQDPMEKPSKSKKKPLSKKQQALVQQKLSLLSQNLRPIPLSPPSPKTLDSISAHEPLFRSLGLWDFAALHLDGDLRRDLLAELIAHYEPDKHHSLVRGLRLKLSRADLGRALSLPKSPSGGGGGDFDAAGFGGAEEVAAVLWGFISDMMVFLDDAAILPPEVMVANGLLKEGKPNRVDWAGLMWMLVEREILAAPENGSCYYAAHLQCLMKYQKPRLFEEMEGDPEPEPEQSEAATVTVDEEDGDADGDGEEIGVVGSERCGPGLSLGVGGEGEECKESLEDCLPECRDLSKEQPDKEGRPMEGVEHTEASQQANLSKEQPGKEGRPMEGVEHYSTEALQQVNLSKEEPDGVQCRNLITEGTNQRHVAENDEPSKMEETKGKRVDNGVDDELVGAKFPTLERLTSSDFMQVMGTGNNLAFGLEQSNGDFLATGSDMQNKGMGLEMGQGSSFLLGNEHKRGIGEIDYRINGLRPSHQQKRLRSDQPWENTPSIIGFEGCMEQVQHFMGKAHVDLVEKEKAYMNVQEQIHYLSQIVQQKDEIIRSLEKTSMEQLRRREMEVTRFNHDIKTLSSIVFGCKRALKETQSAFAEYRRSFPIADEPLHTGDSGTGCDVGARDLIKSCLTNKEEMRQLAQGMIDDFYKGWSDKLNKYATQVSLSCTKLVQLKEDMEHIKERLAAVKNQNHG